MWLWIWTHFPMIGKCWDAEKRPCFDEIQKVLINWDVARMTKLELMRYQVDWDFRSAECAGCIEQKDSGLENARLWRTCPRMVPERRVLELQWWDMELRKQAMQTFGHIFSSKSTKNNTDVLLDHSPQHHVQKCSRISTTSSQVIFALSSVFGLFCMGKHSVPEIFSSVLDTWIPEECQFHKRITHSCQTEGKVSVSQKYVVIRDRVPTLVLWLLKLGVDKLFKGNFTVTERHGSRIFLFTAQFVGWAWFTAQQIF